MKEYAIDKLVRELSTGNLDVFDQIYYETKDLVYYVIFNILRNDLKAEELMQEVYLNMLRKVSKYKKKNFSAWIATMARNMAINTYNKEKRISYMDSQEMEFVFKSDSNSDEEYLLNDMRRILNETEFEVVLMHVIGNITHQKISDGLGKPIGTVLWIYNKAMKKLRAGLEVK
ncbi:sigma-70 family RNA polymerase sigma factor [Mycoplasmatota bacterium zrk1]